MSASLSPDRSLTGKASTMSILAIAVGSALGALLRWYFSTRLNLLFPRLPPGTSAANILGLSDRDRHDGLYGFAGSFAGMVVNCSNRFSRRVDNLLELLSRSRDLTARRTRLLGNFHRRRPCDRPCCQGLMRGRYRTPHSQHILRI